MYRPYALLGGCLERPRQLAQNTQKDISQVGASLDRVKTATGTGKEQKQSNKSGGNTVLGANLFLMAQIRFVPDILPKFFVGTAKKD